jgi:hypothetical protein
MAERICLAVAASDKGLRGTLEADPELPAFGTVQQWLSKHSSFKETYADAKRLQIEAMAEDIVDLANDETLDPNDKRIRIDTRKWLLSKLMHKTYGDKLDVTSGGEALAAPAHSIDARVQSIIMQAHARKRSGAGLIEALPDEAKSLLE